MKLDANKTYNIMTCCGYGNGTCELLGQTVKKALDSVGIKAKVKAGPVSFGKSQYRDYDMIFCNRGLLKNFDAAISYGTVVIGLKNVMSTDEILQAIEEYNCEK